VNTSNDPTLVDFRAVAAILGLRPSWVWVEAVEGRLPCISVGYRDYRFSVEAVKQAIAERAQQMPPDAPKQKYKVRRAVVRQLWSADQVAALVADPPDRGTAKRLLLKWARDGTIDCFYHERSGNVAYYFDLKEAHDALTKGAFAATCGRVIIKGEGGLLC
jgi:hypothetical protein